MASGGHHGPTTAHVASTGTTPKIVTPGQTERRDLASWWKTFKRGNAREEEHKGSHGIFGVPLHQSIRYANVAISLFNDEGQSYIYGYVPIVVAKCGVFLKEKATDVEGIFRLAGSEKRIKELKIAFDSPDRFGKGLDWTGYTVHDAANILRRYFNQLPEPIIPLEFYERFRTPLRNHQQQAVGAMESQSPDSGSFDAESAIRAYQALITELPPLNRQLLLYILDLLAVFASKSDLNKMTTPNLAAIFQPGLLSHPQHDMAPQEYRLSQDVLIFLIENQDSFLVGMPGTAADEKTVKEVQSGVPSPAPGSPATPSRSKTLGRSSSNASAGADSVRKFGNLRRNVSVSSKNSRNSISGQGTSSPLLSSPGGASGGIHRSNTVPSKRPAGSSPRYGQRGSNPSTPSPTTSFQGTSTPLNTTAENESEQVTPIATRPPPSQTQSQQPPPPLEVLSASSSEATTPLAAPGSDTSSAVLVPKEYRDAYGTLAPPTMPVRGGSSERSLSGSGSFLGIFKQPPGSDGERKDSKQPRKLQKKRIPGSALSSAASSAADLQSGDEQAYSPMSSSFHRDINDALVDMQHDRSEYTTARSTPRSRTPHRQDTDTTLRPTASPPQSYRSASATDMSDAEVTDDSTVSTGQRERRRWRFSQSVKGRRPEQQVETPKVPRSDHSRSTTGSSSVAGRRHSVRRSQELSPRSFGTGASPPDAAGVLSDSEEKKKGPMSWIRGKIAERKEKDAERRAKSPFKSESRVSLHGASASVSASAGSHAGVPAAESRRSTGKSMEVPRQVSHTPSAANAPVNPAVTRVSTDVSAEKGPVVISSPETERARHPVAIPTSSYSMNPALTTGTGSQSASADVQPQSQSHATPAPASLSAFTPSSSEAITNGGSEDVTPTIEKPGPVPVPVSSADPAAPLTNNATDPGAVVSAEKQEDVSNGRTTAGAYTGAGAGNGDGIGGA